MSQKEGEAARNAGSPTFLRIPILRGDGHCKREGASPTRLALEAKLAAHDLNQPAGDVQAQAPAGLLADIWLVGAEELGEQARLVGAGNAVDVSGHADAHGARLGPRRESDGGANRRIFMRVADQVRDDLD